MKTANRNKQREQGKNTGRLRFLHRAAAFCLCLCVMITVFGINAMAGEAAAAPDYSDENTIADISPEEAVEGLTDNDMENITAQGQNDAAAEAGYVTITDHADREVTVPADPGRVVILDILPLPSVLTIFLGSAESIIAMEPASMNAAKNGILSELFPEILDVRTDIMDGDDVNIESLLMLDPQIVFYNAASTALCEKLENAGLTAVAVSPTKWNYDCIVTYDHWMELLGLIYPSVDISTKVSDYSSRIYDEIQERVEDMDDSERKTVLFLFQYDENTMVTSGSSFFGQWWCDAAGGLNAANEISADNKNAAITMEQVYGWDPDVIIITNFTQTQPEDIYANNIGDDDWSSVKAVKEHEVYKMPLGSYRTYTPGVDTPMTLEWMATILYPELFPEFDITEDVRAYYQELYGVELTDEQVEAMYHPSSDAGSWK